MIDFTHPKVEELHVIYKDATIANYRCYLSRRLDVYDRGMFEKNLDALRSSKERLAALLSEIKTASDISKENMDYCVHWAEEHLPTVDRWLNESEQYQQELEKH
jgi:hypothetical protein